MRSGAIWMFDTLHLKAVYNSNDNDIAKEFYNLVLKDAVTFDRVSAYFSGKALALYSQGLEYFGMHGNRYRLIVSTEISESDYEEIKKGYKIKEKLQQNLLGKFGKDFTVSEKKALSNLAFFIANGTVDIKMAFRPTGIFHDKCGILIDSSGNKICFHGSNNETEAALSSNYESMTVTCSWLDKDGFYNKGIEKTQRDFDKLWNNDMPNLTVLPVEDVIINKILKFNKGKVIMEDILLKGNAMILDYDGQLILHINDLDINDFVSSAFYKTKIKSKVSSIEKNVIVFKSDLVYVDFIKIGNQLENKKTRFRCEFYKTNRLKEYIDSRNLHIKERSKLGIELKTDAKNIQEQYNKFKKVVDDSMTRKLREKQMRDSFFMYAMNKSGNFSVPGSGKTASALGVYAFLKANDIVDKIVMIGPKNAFGSWMDEFINCFGQKEDLNCFNLHGSNYNNKTERKRALRFECGSCNLFLINYESAHSYIDELINIVSHRTLLVFDEVHRVKGIGGVYAKTALDISKYAEYIIAMSGTPIPNTYKDIYNFLHILFHDEYKEFFGFDVAYLKDPSKSEIYSINDKIQPFFCRTTKKELNVPEANEDISIYVDASKQEQFLFEVVRKKYSKNPLALFIRLIQLESNPELLLEALDLSEFARILDIDADVDEIDYVDYSKDVIAAINAISITTKKKECIKTIISLTEEHKPVIVWCFLKDSIRSIVNILSKYGITAKAIYGAVELDDRQKFLDEFRNNDFEVLVTNPHTLAESVSLHSICHDAVYFEYSYNLVHLLQSKDRINRLGLPKKQYTQYYFMKNVFSFDGFKYSLGDKVYNRLKEKEQTMLDAIDNHILEPVYTTEEDLKAIFGSIL